MDLANRVLIVIMAALFIVFWVAVIVTLVVFPDQTIDNVRRLLNSFEDNRSFARFVAGLLGAALLLTSLLILILEFFPEAKSVQLTHVTGGTAHISTDAIAQRIKHDAEDMAAVREAKPSVTVRGKDRVDVKVEMQLERGATVAAASEGVLRQARASVEDLGVKLAEVKVHIAHLPKGTGMAQREAPAAPPPAAPEAPKSEQERPEGQPEREQSRGPLWDEPSKPGDGQA